VAALAGARLGALAFFSACPVIRSAMTPVFSGIVLDDPRQRCSILALVQASTFLALKGDGVFLALPINETQQ
jgi:hypothetical protein